jgi:glycosyltransferase involved in cell wall biosynthesis
VHFWLIQVGEPLPTDQGRPRLLRTGLLAAELVRRGHRVTWWASTFRHGSKTHRADRSTELTVEPGYRLMLLHSPGYRSNVSLRRLLDHRALAREFRDWARRESPPDLIHCGFPTIELAFEAAAYAQERAVPLAIDARDMWPDIFVGAVPGPLRPLLRVALGREFRMAGEAFRQATAVTAHAPGFVDWGLRCGNRARSRHDRDFPFAYPVTPPSADVLQLAERFWNEQGLSAKDERFVVCFFGTFAARKEVDLATVIRAARELQSALPSLVFVLCGVGPAAARYHAMARGLKNVVFPGWIDSAQIWTLMRRSRLGLLPYLPSEDFRLSLPNKSIEYLSAGLPILTSLRGGYLESVLQEGGCGVFYEGGDPASLVEAVCRIAADPLSLDAQRAAAGILFSERFRSDVVYGAMTDYLEELAEAR